ncbi:MAG TPA: hypothetical protein VN666_09435 [Nitrospira sp.]|nr:hypothetical protein [Nitrospira sp.]
MAMDRILYRESSLDDFVTTFGPLQPEPTTIATRRQGIIKLIRE